MAAPAAPSGTGAELLALRQQAEQTRLAAGQTIRRAVSIYIQATRQQAADQGIDPTPLLAVTAEVLRVYADALQPHDVNRVRH